MRNLIKVLIALTFIAVAFWVCNYVADEKCSIQINELNKKSEVDKRVILQLQDSLTLLKTELEEQKVIKHFDTVKTKQTIKQGKK
ncbi:MAG: hypothetical protein HY960_04140 [Ignavibacteriae bacterium]|nr:hypothetical protein [Ignavibacteriota bacterium]